MSYRIEWLYVSIQFGGDLHNFLLTKLPLAAQYTNSADSQRHLVSSSPHCQLAAVQAQKVLWFKALGSENIVNSIKAGKVVILCHHLLVKMYKVITLIIRKFVVLNNAKPDI